MGHRYIGSKIKILDEVVSKIKQIAPARGRVVDLMSGTASVSAALRKAGFKVTAVDLMTYSFHHARVALLLGEAPAFQGAEGFLKKFPSKSKISVLSNYEKVVEGLNLVTPRKGYFFNEFSLGGSPKRNYFSVENSKKIDGMRFWIKKLHKVGSITDIEHSLLLHDLIMASNDVANISGTYGHYMSKLIGRAKDPIKLKMTVFSFADNTKGHKVIQGYAEDVSKSISADLCYIDPPYMKRQYAANYHLLETLGREDDPVAAGKSGLRPWRDQYSNFCTKTKIRSSFQKIFTSMKCNDFLISYSEDGLLPLRDLEEFFSTFGIVEVNHLVNKRFRSNKSPLATQLTEYLIHLKIKR